MHEPYSYIPLTRVDQQVSQETGFTFSSPLLFDLLNSLSKDKYHEVLTLLPANQGVIDLFSRFHCKLYLPDCLQELCEMTSDRYDTATKLNRTFTKKIGIYKKQKAALNLIFLWDLPNYLDKQVMKGLIEYLLQHVHKNVKLHLYIHTREHMSSSPSVYSIMPGGKIWLENSANATVKSPLYFQEALQTLLHPFQIKRSMMLSSGLQEYILEF